MPAPSPTLVPMLRALQHGHGTVDFLHLVLQSYGQGLAGLPVHRGVSSGDASAQFRDLVFLIYLDSWYLLREMSCGESKA